MGLFGDCSFLSSSLSAGAPAQVSSVGGVDAAIIEGVLLIKLDEPTAWIVEADTDGRCVVVEKTSEGVPPGRKARSTPPGL